MNIGSPELKAFKRAPCLELSKWEHGNLVTNLAETRRGREVRHRGAHLTWKVKGEDYGIQFG